MELPPYRIPSAKSVFRHTWEKGRQYLQKMGGIILVFSLVIWALSYFPRPEGESLHLVQAPAAALQPTDTLTAPVATQAVTEAPVAKVPETNTAAQSAVAAVPQPQSAPSYLERLGRLIAPVLAPMDFDWRMTVGILSGVGAKELVVSTLAVLYAGEEVDTDAAAHDSVLLTALRTYMTPASALAYLVFVLFYFPCIATIVAIKNETGGWKWAVFTALYTTALAYVASLIAYWLMM